MTELHKRSTDHTPPSFRIRDFFFFLRFSALIFLSVRISYVVVERDNYDRSIRIIDRKDMVTRDPLSFALFPRCCVILRISRRRSDVGRGKTPSFEADCYPSLPREYFSLSRAANRNIPFFLFFFFFPLQIVAISSISASETTNVPFENYSRLHSQFLRFGSFPPRDSRVISCAGGKTSLEKKSR